MSYILGLSQSKLLPDEERYPVSIFCSRNDSEEGVVVSIALQLLRCKVRVKASKSRFHISKFHISKSHPDDRRLAFNRLLWELLATLITCSSEAVLIIDGIDKLESSVRRSFLDRFGKLEDEVMGTTDMRVLISSEKTDDIQNALSHYSSIDREKERRGE